jgi:hypothetical protein
MGPKTVVLCETLRETCSLLSGAGERHWAKWLAESLRRIENGDFSGITHLRDAFGGMGSFNDLVLGSFNGHAVGDAEFRQVNESLDSLRSELYELSDYIRRHAEVKE